MIKQLIVVLFCVFYSTGSVAQQGGDSVAEDESVQLEAVSGPGEAFFKPGGWVASLYAGRLDSASEPHFVGIRAEYALGLGLSGTLNNYPYLALDVELFGAHREFDTPVSAPIFGTVDNDTSLDTTALLLGIRASFPAQGKLRAYASTGLGYFRNDMSVSGSVFGLPASLKESDNNLDIYIGAGVSYLFGRWGLSLDYRHFAIEGGFSEFNISDADLGGDIFVLGLGYGF